MSTLRKAVPEDAAAIEAFLQGHAITSMYLRGNLAAHGVGFTDHALSTEFYLWCADAIEGVFGITRSGYLMAQVPDMPEKALTGFIRRVAGRTTLGMTGPVDQVEPVLRACGLKAAAFQLDHEEPLFCMGLEDLPSERELCRPMDEADLPWMEPWFADYMSETGLFDRDTALKNARARAREDFESGEIRIIEDQGVPVAMARFNARVGEHAQVGGVFVPSGARRKGHGRRIMQALLQDGWSRGIRVASLFANSPEAARLYEQIGFEQVSWYRIALLASPQIIGEYVS